MASVLDLVKHYQNKIIECHEEKNLLKYLDALSNLDVTVQHLQETGVGRTVNALRKEPGQAGLASRALVNKWKAMVAAEDSGQEDGHDDTTTYNGTGKDSDDNAHQSRTKHERSSSAQKQVQKEYSKHVNGNHSGDKRKYSSSEEEEPEIKKSRNPNSSDDYYKKKKDPKTKYSESDSYDSESESETSESNSSEQEVQIKEEKIKVPDKYKSSKQSSHNNHASHKDYSSSSKKSSHSSYEHSERHSSHPKERHSNEKSSSKDVSHNSDKQKISKEKDKCSERKHKSDHKSHSDKNHKDSKSSSKYSYSEKHKSSSSSHKDDKNEKHKSTSEKHSDYSEKHKCSSEPESTKKEKHKNKLENDISKHKTKDKTNGSSSSKAKNSSSSKENLKEREQNSSSRDKTNSDSGEKKQSSSNSNRSSSKSNSKDSNDHSTEKKSKHKSSSSHHNSSKSSSNKTKEDVPKKKVRFNEEDSDDGIDCGSGASFAEALGMISPTKSKKKSYKDVQSPTNTFTDDLSPAALLSPSAKLAPLPNLEITSLPEISPNYKPRPPPKFLPHFTEEEAISAGISSKNQRTKVYSGNKVLGKVPSLYELCVQVLIEHIDALEYTGGVPYKPVLKPVVDRATPQQLFTLEHYNPYLMEDTDHLWKKFCERDFRKQQRQELESWREMYMRCQEEQEHKLRSLTANIKIAQEAKKAPIKQTKMAYVDTVVKPPRNVARKQAQHGTAHASTASPAARVAALASAANVLKPGSVRPPSAAAIPSSSFQKPKKAPLMQKALQFMRGRKR